MNEGPTTVGSIVAKIRADRAEWKAAVAQTKEDARELGALRPDIHINDNAAAVTAKMAATKAAVDAVDGSTGKLAGTQGKVATAQTRLTAAMSAADTAYARAALAQMRLNELEEKGITTGSRYASAQLALSEAVKRLDSANDKVIASELALAAARQANAAAADREAAATVKANEANKTSVTRIGAIATAVALLVPLLAPVGAATIGLAGGFLGLGVAGVAALFGINQEMKRGSDVGQAYRSGLDSLKGSLSGLSQTSAVAMLGSFRRVVAETNAAMPMLNTQTAQFSSLLGEAGAAAYSGTINSLRVLNPLFLTAAVYVRSLMQGFQQWTEGSGIEKFGGYALSMLPKVTEALGALASSIMHILEALAPLGTIGLAVLTGVAETIEAIPVDVLSQLIVTLTWGAIGFKAWGFVAPMLSAIAVQMGAVGAATTIATGPIGWIVAGLSALAGIFAVVMANNSGATRAMQDYTAAVDADTGAIGENVRAKAAQKLIDDGVIDAAKRLKLSTQDVLEATLGNAAAQKRLNDAMATGENGSEKQRAQLQRTGLDLVDYTLAVTTLTQGIDTNSAAIKGQVDQYNDLHGMLTQVTGASQAQQRADEAVAASLGISVGALQAARNGQDDMKASTEKATAQMYLQNDAAGLLRASLDLLNGKTISAEQAQNRFDSSLANMGAHIDKTGKDVNRATTSLEGMSAAAVANRGELISSVQAAQDAAQAYRDNGASSDEARQKLIDMKTAIIEHAVELGEDRDQVQAFIDKLFQIPAEVPKTKVEVDADEAKAEIQGLKQLLDGINRNISIAVQLHGADNIATTGGYKVAFANGGTARGLANGGGGTVTGRGTAGSDSAGMYRLAHGEEVVGNVFGQADRNRTLLKQINAGFTPSPTSITATPAPAPQERVVEQHFHVAGVQQEDPRVLGMIVGGEVARALVGVKAK
ncbi:hypothetical protein [Microbacterium sp. PM5]|uniref:hypothetical protein n=1 Tax=Microbacterium sp. PM5 TaxID=2014534 RepID=UPI000DD17A64|nr:hypothetical protein [Microbacterium sp. PM5]AXA97583.1 hypothetical protein CEP17_14795 [Microbacterium sp. PM5]